MWVLRHEQIDRGKLSPLIGTKFARDVPPLLPKLRINNTEFEAAINDDEDGPRYGNDRRISKNRRKLKQRFFFLIFLLLISKHLAI